MLVDSTSNLTLDAVHYLKEYARSGLPIIISGGDPGCYLTRNGHGCTEIHKGISSLKNEENVYSISSGGAAAKLRSLGISPRTGVHTNGTWYTTWREDIQNGTEYAFVFSDGNSSVGDIGIATKKRPYFFDLWSGETKPVFEYKQEDGKTVIPLRLAGNQTVVIGFRESEDAPLIHATQVPETVQGYEYQDSDTLVHVSSGAENNPLILSTGKTMHSLSKDTISPPFQLTNWGLTVEHWSAPSNLSDASVIADKHNTTHNLKSLISWADIPGLANASGIGYYTTSITWPPQSGSADGAYMILPKILHACRLYVNGQLLPPFDYSAPKADLSEYLKAGENEIQVIVPTVMWNYLRSIFGQIRVSDSPPLLTAMGDKMPGLSDNGLIGTVQVVPYVKLSVGGMV